MTKQLFYNQAEELVTLFNVSGESTISQITITKKMFLQSSRRASNSLQCQWREYKFSDNDYKESVSTIKQKSWKASLLSGKKVHVPT